MTSGSLGVFERTVDKTYSWLDEIGEHIGPDRQRAYHALRAVLFTLRDRLLPDEAFHLSAQLPMLIRGIFWDGYRPAGKPERIDNMEQFLARVSLWLDQIGPIQPDECVRAVFEVLEKHVSEGEMDDIRLMLPADIRSRFSAPQQDRRSPPGARA